MESIREGVMGWFTDLLKQYPALEVARERLALADEKYESLGRENETLKLDNARLRRELEALRSSIPRTEFVESRGVLFKRKPDGTFGPDAYCPDCERVLSTFEESVFPPSCSRCRFQAPFFKCDIQAIIAEL
jgi:hypothetical protein